MNQNSHLLRQRIAFLRWSLPPMLVLMVMVYHLGLMHWVHDTFGHFIYFGTETLFYASVGPLITFWTLKLIEHWLDEKEQIERLEKLRSK